MKWKVLSSEYLHQEPWLTVRKDVCELPNGHMVPAFYVNEYPEWVNLFALTTEGEVIMVEQYRHGVAQTSMELPGGVVDAGEEPQAAVERELLEETGYKAGSMEYLGKICANPSTTNNFMHMYLAKDCVKVAEQNLDDSEEINVHLCSMEEVKTLMKQNKIVQSLHVNCMMYAMEKIGALSY